MSQIDRARRIQRTMNTEGWADVMSVLDDMASGSKDELWEIMAHKPDTLTGKIALKHAIRSKALMDFKETLIDELKILSQTSNRGGE